ncbi:MAG TPA: hypothetical protein VFG74_04305 [Miltoncostaeaceae bacterium]|jgi:hypothetical protein|nr:hypothetical protein [Miltoncostaeaceae bacterium]
MLALTIATAAALAAMLLLIGVAGHGPPPAAADAHHATPAARPAVPAAEVALRQNMRALWEEHVFWTRLAIVDFAAGSPSLPATEKRLLRNQADIGRAVGRVYGAAAGKRLTTLLREHILIAVDVLVAAKSGDPAAVATAQRRWVANADRIAGFLAAANPAWPRAEMRAMMRRHLGLTTTEAIAELTGDYAAGVRAFDRVEVQIRHMADMLSAGIVAQFPARFD